MTGTASSQNTSIIPSDIEITIVVLICIFYTIITLLISRYCTTISQSGSDVPWFHPSSIAALIGLLIGGITNSFNISIQFNDSIFFYVVLPPIIFTAGYTLKKKKFFQYLHQIALYGIVGSLLNFTFIAIAAYYYKSTTLSWQQALLLSSVLAANDEISAISLIKQSDFPRLGALLFGEGVLNDALSIVLFQALLSSYHQSLKVDPYTNTTTSSSSEMEPATSVILPLVRSVIYQIVTSTAIGLTCGLCNARLLKVFTFSRKHPIQQTTLVMLTGYLAYSIAEAIDVSGILTLFVTAVTLSHYSWHSLSKSAKLASRITFVSLSDAAEGFAFAYVGLSLWDVVKGPINIHFSLYMLFVVFISRFVTILILAWTYDLITSRISIDISNPICCIKTNPNIPFLELVAFSLGGVVRGCLCWAQVLQVGGSAEAQVLVQTTLVIVMATTVGCGLLLPLAIPRLTNMLMDSKTTGVTSKKKVGYNSVSNNRRRHSNNSYSSSNSSHSATATAAAGGIGGNSPMKRGNENEEDDEEVSTYSMHLEGSVNDSDEEDDNNYCINNNYNNTNSSHHHTSPTMTPINRTSISNPNSKHTDSNDRNSIYLKEESKQGYQSFGEYNSRKGYQSITIPDIEKQHQKPVDLMERDKSIGSTSYRLKNSKKLRKYSLLFLLWIRIDEEYLKPLFGGSTLTYKKAKSKALSMTKSLKAYEMLSPVKVIAVESDADDGEEDDDDDDDDNDGDENNDDHDGDGNHGNKGHQKEDNLHSPIEKEGNSNIKNNNNDDNDSNNENSGDLSKRHSLSSVETPPRSIFSTNSGKNSRTGISMIDYKGSSMEEQPSMSLLYHVQQDETIELNHSVTNSPIHSSGTSDFIIQPYEYQCQVKNKN